MTGSYINQVNLNFKMKYVLKKKKIRHRDCHVCILKHNFKHKSMLSICIYFSSLFVLSVPFFTIIHPILYCSFFNCYRTLLKPSPD